MHNELLKIGPYTVYGYGLMIAIGICTAYIMAEYRAKKKGLPYEQILSLSMWCALGGLFSAKLLYWIIQWREILSDPLFIFRSIGDGFVVYGGIIGGILTGYLYCKRQKLYFLQFFDLVMPSVAMAQGFGRIGCFLAGCCYGKETESFLSITFRESVFAPNGVSLIPTQIYSSILDFLHAGFLIWFSGRKVRDGQTAACYLIFYSIGRFGMEFFRGDLERGAIAFLSTSQFISIGMFIIGISLWFWSKNRKREPKRA